MRYVVGVGNYSMGDDGVGLHLIEQLEKQRSALLFELRDIGADGLRLLSLFEPETEKILLLDCMLLGLQPGDYRIFSVDDVESVKPRQGLSTHEGDILKTMALAKSAGYHIPPVRLMGIEPESMGQSMSLSSVLQSRMEEYIEAVVQEMRG